MFNKQVNILQTHTRWPQLVGHIYVVGVHQLCTEQTTYNETAYCARPVTMQSLSTPVSCSIKRYVYAYHLLCSLLR